MSLQFDHHTHRQRVLFGAGRAVANTVTVARQFRARAVLLVASGSAAPLADAITARVDVAARIDGVAQHVPERHAADARRQAHSSSADLIICVGGGSATGLAKAVALTTSLPIVAVPTTFSGSEATDMWGVTVDGQKLTGSDHRVVPHTVVYDPDVLANLPRAQTISSLFNAVAHAVDGFWAPCADPVNAALATEGLRSLLPAIAAAGADQYTAQVRESALYGAYLAAVAFASSGSGMHHKMCHVLGGTYALPHAELHTVLLPYVTSFNAAAAPEALHSIAGLLSTPDAATGLRSLAAATGAPLALRDLGFPACRISEAAERCLAALPPSNPRPVALQDMTTLLQDAYDGSMP